jgi:hypothetical protein
VRQCRNGYDVSVAKGLSAFGALWYTLNPSHQMET